MKFLIITVSIVIAIILIISISLLFYPEYLGLYENQTNDVRVIFVNEALSYEEYPPQFLGSERRFNELYGIIVELNSDELLKFPALVTAMSNIGKSDLNKIQGFTQIDDIQYSELKHLLMKKASIEKPNRVDNPSTMTFSYNDQEYHIDFKLFSEIWDYPLIVVTSYDEEKYPTLIKYSGFVTLNDDDLKIMPKLKESLFKNKHVPLWKIEQLSYQSYLNEKFIQKYSTSDLLLSSNIVKYNDNFYSVQFMSDHPFECVIDPCIIN